MLDPQLISLAQQAWEAVKDPSQPSWNDCQARHRQLHLAAAKAVLKGGPVNTPFEQKVRDLLRQPEIEGHSVSGLSLAEEIDYALPHSQFLAEKRARHGDEELALAAGIRVDQHETVGANKVGEAPKEKDVPQPVKASSSKSSKSSQKKNQKSPRKSKARPSKKEK